MFSLFLVHLMSLKNEQVWCKLLKLLQPCHVFKTVPKWFGLCTGVEAWEKKTSRSENWTFSTVNNSETTCSPELQCVSLWHLSEVKIAVISWLLPKVEKEKIAH